MKEKIAEKKKYYQIYYIKLLKINREQHFKKYSHLYG